MTSWNDLKNGMKVKCLETGLVLDVMVWRGQKYLAGHFDMWPVTEFDPKDWEIVNKKGK